MAEAGERSPSECGGGGREEGIGLLRVERPARNTGDAASGEHRRRALQRQKDEGTVRKASEQLKFVFQAEFQFACPSRSRPSDLCTCRNNSLVYKILCIFMPINQRIYSV